MTNLLRREIVNADAAKCVAGCIDESTSHLFMHCVSFGSM